LMKAIKAENRDAVVRAPHRSPIALSWRRPIRSFDAGADHARF